MKLIKYGNPIDVAINVDAVDQMHIDSNNIRQILLESTLLLTFIDSFIGFNGSVSWFLSTVLTESITIIH